MSNPPDNSLPNYGFIISRHVNSELTNNYWNTCIKCIRRFYPLKKIVIIDDNSDKEFLKADYDYRNIEIINSEYPGRGELLPYYYFHKYKWFNNAVIIHDGIFFNARIHFEKYIGLRVLPLWHFNADDENYLNSYRLIAPLNNKYIINEKIMSGSNKNLVIQLQNKIDWYGCFGVQSFINLRFLNHLQHKYNLFKLLTVVKCRADRCCLERIFGILFHTEAPETLKLKSLFGNIFTYTAWGYTFDEYKTDCIEHNPVKKVVKVWTGR